MKYILIVSLFLLSFAANGQKVHSTTDTTKKKADTYYLFGKIENFQLLHKALTSPMDVTPNQMKALDEWIIKGLMVADTSNHK